MAMIFSRCQLQTITQTNKYKIYKERKKNIMIKPSYIKYRKVLRTIAENRHSALKRKNRRRLIESSKIDWVPDEIYDMLEKTVGNVVADPSEMTYDFSYRSNNAFEISVYAFDDEMKRQLKNVERFVKFAENVEGVASVVVDEWDHDSSDETNFTTITIKPTPEILRTMRKYKF